MKTIISGLLMFSSICAIADSDKFSSEVKKLLASEAGKVSFSLRDSSGAELVNFHGDKALAPASIAKTISTSCSLDELGPQFQFETLFGMSGKLQGDTLVGDLVIQGSGDPGLVIEDLHEVVEKLRFVHGIKKISGNLLFDLSYFGQKSIPMSNGFEGDEGRSFTADLTPIIMNQNSFSIWVTADLADGGKTRAVTLPANVTEVKLVNKTKLASGTEVSVSYDPNQLIATVSGGMARDGEPKGIYRAVDDPYDYDLKLFRRLWLDAGGVWEKPVVKFSNSALKFVPLWKYQSRPLSKLMMDVNKFSLNLGAEMIFLAAGAEKFGRPASYEKSLKLLKECLASRKIEPGSFVLTNGSGLSREALIKTTALSQFLVGASQSGFAPEYMSSFGLLGIDGTSKSRLKNYAGRARLKTGSLKDVRSIAGYLYSKDHRIYSFSMIQNSVSSNEAKKLEDEVIETFMRNF